MTHTPILCTRTGCANNNDGACSLVAPTLIKREGLDAYVNCLDQVNA